MWWTSRACSALLKTSTHRASVLLNRTFLPYRTPKELAPPDSAAKRFFCLRSCLPRVDRILQSVMCLRVGVLFAVIAHVYAANVCFSRGGIPSYCVVELVVGCFQNCFCVYAERAHNVFDMGCSGRVWCREDAMGIILISKGMLDQNINHKTIPYCCKLLTGLCLTVMRSSATI